MASLEPRLSQFGLAIGWLLAREVSAARLAVLFKTTPENIRVIAFRAPSHPLREEYLRRLSLNSLRPKDLHCAAAESEGLSFAQLREAFILAGRAVFGRELTVPPGELISGIRLVRSDRAQIRLGSEGRNPGFSIQHDEGMAVSKSNDSR